MLTFQSIHTSTHFPTSLESLFLSMILISQVTPVTKSTRRFYLGAQILAQKGIPSGSLVLISSLPATHNEKPLNVTKKASRSHPDVSTITKVATYPYSKSQVRR